jgi:hypothetical protein
VPVDENDDAKKLAAYVEKWKPRYRMLSGLPVAERRKVDAFLRGQSGAKTVPLPSTVVTDGAGRVVEIFGGVPSVSDLRRLMVGGR